MTTSRVGLVVPITETVFLLLSRIWYFNPLYTKSGCAQAHIVLIIRTRERKYLFINVLNK